MQNNDKWKELEAKKISKKAEKKLKEAQYEILKKEIKVLKEEIETLDQKQFSMVNPNLFNKGEVNGK